jgi:hypothetical protein
MALNRDKIRNIVGGITTVEPPQETPPPEMLQPQALVIEAEQRSSGTGQGRRPPAQMDDAGQEADAGEHRRFAKRGRPKGKKDDVTNGKGRKVKVSLFLSEVLVNDLYDWAHADRVHPGEMFERALKPFHEREAKRRNAGKG